MVIYLLEIIIGIMIPLFGTILGASFVFLLKKNISDNTKKFIMGLSAGVMLAASIWSLIIPAINLSNNNPLPTIIGFVLGMMGLLLINKVLEKRNNVNMLNLSVIIHNIPEGLSVGVAIAGALSNNTFAMTSAILLSIGIGIQNIPEGSIISLNSLSIKSKFKSFIDGILSGVVEPIASIIAIVLVIFITPVMPYFLSFAAGAMIFVCVNELIPNSQGTCGIIGVTIGFSIMMFLDVILG
jgi:ZIP family zinc transporter